MQAAVSTIRLPNGLAGAGSAIASGTLAADCIRWSSARSSVVRLSAWTLKVAGRRTPAAGAAASARSTAASAGSVDGRGRGDDGRAPGRGPAPPTASDRHARGIDDREVPGAETEAR